ncbi:MAG TPA: carboxypeptidase regulatory-like domain-containing protein [Terriglobia bacterium]|nr:carboxypeptidase regulatory-like domain-containing protein [Terriglobia bacterium]
MRRAYVFLWLSAVIILSQLNGPAFATALATVRGIVHDPNHRPVENAEVVIRSRTSNWSASTRSDSDGEFHFKAVPPGDYTLKVTAEGFSPAEQSIPAVTAITAAEGKSAVIHVPLEIAATRQVVEVTGRESRLKTQSSTVETRVSAQEVARTAGADQTNSLAMITDFTPGATMVHDMLHMREGHQVNWFFDGIPVINTSIAANVAPLINPKNVESLEVERGGYSSEYGDRTYGFFNVVTPSGFERNNQAELVASYGNFHTTDDQLSFGGHTERFAYYGSLDGDRSDLGLTTPTSAVIHDQSSGLGGFLSLLYNASPRDQVRWIVSLRNDHYAIPNDAASQAAGIRDLDVEGDGLLGFQWAHTTGGLIFTLSPYLHMNSAHYISGPGDMPLILDDNSRSTYVGARAMLQALKKRHNVRVGLEVWGQHNNTLFGLTANPGAQVLQQQELHWANTDSLFVEDQYRPNSWLTLDGGIRLVHYSGLLSQNAASPRLGGGIRIPHLDWILRGYYSYYYQPPPLDSLSGPLLRFTLQQGFGFTPLPGERDIQRDFGLTVPLRGPLGEWAVDLDNYHTNARNFLDHDEVGNSGIFIPLTDLAAVIGGNEISLRSPQVWGHARLRFVYANAVGKGLGPITGGLIEFAPTRYFYLDHDQRNTFSGVLSLQLPRRFWATPVVNFGSGFVNGNGPAHLPPHTTADLALGRNCGENWSFSLNSTNVLNSRYLLDTSNTFGGTHTENARQIYGELRYRFHY